MTSYCCQICRVDLSIARIRTPDDPPETAWNHEGRNYVGFAPFRGFYNDIFPDQQCQQCTTLDRTPVNFLEDAEHILSGGPLLAEKDDEDDDWLPEDNSDATDELLEYDSEAESSMEPSSLAESDAEGDASTRKALRELHRPEPPTHLPHGTWLNGHIYSRDYGREMLHQVLERGIPSWYDQPPDLPALAVPKEHVAAQSCKSLQGINGHVLSVEEMKHCRLHRFLLPKPPRWQADFTDKVFESSNNFVLSGEANGSHTTSHNKYPVVYPPRYDAAKVPLRADPNYGCNISGELEPLPVHSYCLDIYAKASYRRLGRVDLDGIWHWREMVMLPNSYNLTNSDLQPCFEVSRAHQDSWSDPWCHHTGDEWLAANPVVIPGFRGIPASFLTSVDSVDKSPRQNGSFITLPSELIHYIVSFLGESDLYSAASTCRTLHHHTQFACRALVLEHMDWLWEVFEGTYYPDSPNRPATWDARFPTGLIPPEMPYGLQAEEDENELWKQITDENSEMCNIGAAVKLINSLRRDVLLGPDRGSSEWALSEWKRFRTAIEDWVCHLPSKISIETQALDWVRLWRLCNPTTTPFPGLRNRARIWADCQRILDLNARPREQSNMETNEMEVRHVLSSNRVQWWERARSRATSNFDDP